MVKTMKLFPPACSPSLSVPTFHKCCWNLSSYCIINSASIIGFINPITYLTITESNDNSYTKRKMKISSYNTSPVTLWKDKECKFLFWMPCRKTTCVDLLSCSKHSSSLQSKSLRSLVGVCIRPHKRLCINGSPQTRNINKNVTGAFQEHKGNNNVRETARDSGAIHVLDNMVNNDAHLIQKERHKYFTMRTTSTRQ